MTLLNPNKVYADSQWELVTPGITMTDDMGNPVTATRAQRGARISYLDSGEPAPSLNRLQQVYIDWREHDILVGEHDIYVRPRPHYLFV